MITSSSQNMLHWLAVKLCITFNLTTMTFTVLTFCQPSYLANLLTLNTPQLLGSSSLNHIVVPFHEDIVGIR
jgi:hypothetical protein